MCFNSGKAERKAGCYLASSLSMCEYLDFMAVAFNPPVRPVGMPTRFKSAKRLLANLSRVPRTFLAVGQPLRQGRGCERRQIDWLGCIQSGPHLSPIAEAL